MTNEQFEQWVAALRSEAFEQARDQLVGGFDETGCYTRKAKHCCIAVYQALHEPDTSWVHAEAYPKYEEFPAFLQRRFVDANDVEQMSFEQIADLAESMREELVF